MNASTLRYSLAVYRYKKIRIYNYYTRRLLRNTLPAYPNTDTQPGGQTKQGYSPLGTSPAIYHFALSLKISFLLHHFFSVGRIKEVEHRVDLISEGMLGRNAGLSADKLLLYLMRYISAKRFNKDSHIHVEIGTLHGGSLIATLIALQDAGSPQRVVCIDPLDGYYGAGLDPKSAVPVDRNTVEENINRFGFARRQVKIVQHYSTEKKAIGALKGHKIASLFIDGDHSYEGIKADWANYAPLVVPRGYVMLDNYNDASWPGITEFVHRELKGCSEEWQIVGTMNISVLLQRK